MRRRRHLLLLCLLLAGCSQEPVASGPVTVGMPPAPNGALAIPGTELALDGRGPVWLDDHRLLTLQADKGIRRIDGSLEIQGNEGFYEVDVRTGKRTPSSFLNGSVRHAKQRDGTTLVDMPLGLAARGGWLLYTRAAAPNVWVARSLDGKRSRSWRVPKNTDGRAFWFPDGRRWMMTAGSTVDVYDMRGMESQALTVEKPAGEEGLNGLYVLGFLGPDRLLAKGATSNGGGIYRIDLQDGFATATRVDHIERDDSLGFNDVVLSPDGTMLAYRSGEQALKVSDIEGSRSIELSPRVSSETIAWSPDSTRIVFGAKGCLWSVDAPRLSKAQPSPAELGR